METKWKILFVIIDKNFIIRGLWKVIGLLNSNDIESTTDSIHRTISSHVKKVSSVIRQSFEGRHILEGGGLFILSHSTQYHNCTQLTSKTGLVLYWNTN
jgi:hypothetical protein